MNDYTLIFQIIGLMALILCSAFFSGSETSMLSLNKHKLSHLAKSGDKRAKVALNLLTRPDRLLGTILLGNNFINILAASLATVIGLKLWGDIGILIMTVILTVVVLIFGELAPKTFAALNAEKFALPVAKTLKLLLKLLYPLVWLINSITAVILKPLGIKDFNYSSEDVSREEIRSMLAQTSAHIDEQKKNMMLGVLHLDDIIVEDIMVPKRELMGLDLDDDWEVSKKAILDSEYARLLVYEEKLENVEGILHLRDIVSFYRDGKPLSKENVKSILRPPYFVPQNAPLRKQLNSFQKNKKQTAIIVDEYGEMIGLLTLEDILEYMVGDLGLKEIAEENELLEDIVKQSENTYQVLGSISINYLNKVLDWNLESEEATTFSGLILEELGQYPTVGTTLTISDYHIEVTEVDDDVVSTALVTLLEPEED